MTVACRARRTSRTSALRAVASDWTLSGIARFFSGRRLNVTMTSDPARTGIANQRPNLVLDNPYGDKSFTNYLNRAAFAEPALGTLGNLQRNGIVGPGTKVVDVALVRLFRFGGTHTVEARAEAFNAFNWFNPSTIGQQLAGRESQQRAVRPDHRGGRSADPAVRDQVFVLARTAGPRFRAFRVGAKRQPRTL